MSGNIGSNGNHTRPVLDTLLQFPLFIFYSTDTDEEDQKYGSLRENEVQAYSHTLPKHTFDTNGSSRVEW